MTESIPSLLRLIIAGELTAHLECLHYGFMRMQNNGNEDDCAMLAAARGRHLRSVKLLITGTELFARGLARLPVDEENEVEVCARYLANSAVSACRDLRVFFARK